MSDDSMQTEELHGCLERMMSGDRRALDLLLRRVSARLERLARKTLKHFPRVARWADAEDILQNATMKLIRALEEVRPNSMREFYGLAAMQIRRELLDATKQLFGPEGQGYNHQSTPPDDPKRNLEPEARVDDERELQKWCEFHEAVGRLPVEEREVVGLIFYHGWKQSEVATLFGVTVRTVQRWWQSALDTIQGLLSDREPNDR
jgi:RNA polymerase sigma factor (sigma-70 family)